MRPIVEIVKRSSFRLRCPRTVFRRGAHTFALGSVDPERIWKGRRVLRALVKYQGGLIAASVIATRNRVMNYETL